MTTLVSPRTAQVLPSPSGGPQVFSPAYGVRRHSPRAGAAQAQSGQAPTTSFTLVSPFAASSTQATQLRHSAAVSGVSCTSPRGVLRPTQGYVSSSAIVASSQIQTWNLAVPTSPAASVGVGKPIFQTSPRSLGSRQQAAASPEQHTFAAVRVQRNR